MGRGDKGGTGDKGDRRGQRIDVSLRIVMNSDFDLDASDSLMSNLSLGGCFVLTPKPLPVGSPLVLQFKLPGESDGEGIKATGVVRWLREARRESGEGMGIQFTEIRPEHLVILKRFLEEEATRKIFEA